MVKMVLRKINRRIGQTFVQPQCDTTATRSRGVSTGESAKLSSYRSATPGPSGPGQGQPANRPNFRPTAVRLQDLATLANANKRIGQTFVLPQCDSRAKWPWPRPTGESAKLSSSRSATPGPNGPGQGQQRNRPNFRPTAVRLQGQVILAKANKGIGQRNRPNFRPTAVRLQGQVILVKANKGIGQTFVLPQ